MNDSYQIKNDESNWKVLAVIAHHHDKLLMIRNKNDSTQAGASKKKKGKNKCMLTTQLAITL